MWKKLLTGGLLVFLFATMIAPAVSARRPNNIISRSIISYYWETQQDPFAKRRVIRAIKERAQNKYRQYAWNFLTMDDVKIVTKKEKDWPYFKKTMLEMDLTNNLQVTFRGNMWVKVSRMDPFYEELEQVDKCVFNVRNIRRTDTKTVKCELDDYRPGEEVEELLVTLYRGTTPVDEYYLLY